MVYLAKPQTMAAQKKRKHTTTKNTQPNRSRKIPPEVSKKVKERHFFQCAWDGENVIEQHHIKYFHLGGEHTVDNLILLCRNCHKLVHDGVINKEELIKRKSTHLKDDRAPGGLRFPIKWAMCKIGGFTTHNVKRLIVSGDDEILTFEYDNGLFYLTTQFYDIDGNLIFWMHKNKYWAPSNFKVTSIPNQSLEIVDTQNKNHYLKMEYANDQVEVQARCYLQGKLLTITPELYSYRGLTVRNSTANVMYTAIHVNVNLEL